MVTHIRCFEISRKKSCFSIKLMKKLIFVLLLLPCFSACTNIDCPLENVVTMNCGLYATETKTSMKITDTLTVSAGGVKDTILINRATNVSTLNIPLRYAAKEDTLLLRFSNRQGQMATDTLFVQHVGTPHFESADCPLVMFHKLGHVHWTSHALSKMPLTIDSVVVINDNVNYDNVQNIKIYLRPVASM